MPAPPHLMPGYVVPPARTCLVKLKRNESKNCTLSAMLSVTSKLEIVESNYIQYA